MVETDVPKKTVRLRKFHIKLLGTWIGSVLVSWSAKTYTHANRLLQASSYPWSCFHAWSFFCYFLIHLLVNNWQWYSYVKIELWEHLYLIDLEICAIEWETSPHCCSARYLQRDSRKMNNLENEEKMVVSCLCVSMKMCTSSYQDSPSDWLCMFFSCAVALETCFLVAQAIFRGVTFTFWRLNWICGLTCAYDQDPKEGRESPVWHTPHKCFGILPSYLIDVLY